MIDENTARNILKNQMSLNEFINLIIRLYDGDTLDVDVLDLMNDKARELINNMKNNNIDLDSQNALDEYIEYYRNNNHNELITSLINEYDNTSLELEKANNIGVYHEPLVLKPKKKINNDGLISAFAIIEIVSLFGILIVSILLALTKK